MKKKILKFIIIFIIDIIFLCLIFVFISKIKYSRDNIIKLLENSIVPNNIYIEDTTSCTETGEFDVAKFYIKDNIQYIYQETSDHKKVESFMNNEDNTTITLLHTEKAITKDNVEHGSYSIPGNLSLLNKLNNSRYIYNYLGKEKIDEVKCIKISLKSTYDDKTVIYYIDENTGYINKINRTSNDGLEIIENFKYMIDYVTDEQLEEFNPDKYTDYTFFGGI